MDNDWDENEKENDADMIIKSNTSNINSKMEMDAEESHEQQCRRSPRFLSNVKK